MRPADVPDNDPAGLERFARAAAGAAGLEIDDSWWPGVIGHLGVLLARAASLEGMALPDDPGPVFAP